MLHSQRTPPRGPDASAREATGSRRCRPPPIARPGRHPTPRSPENVRPRFLSLRQAGPAQPSPPAREGLRSPGTQRVLARSSGLRRFSTGLQMRCKALRSRVRVASSRAHSDGREAPISKQRDTAGPDPSRTSQRGSLNGHSWPKSACPVWMAPALQGVREGWRAGGVQSCVRPVRAVIDRWP